MKLADLRGRLRKMESEESIAVKLRSKHLKAMIIERCDAHPDDIVFCHVHGCRHYAESGYWVCEKHLDEFEKHPCKDCHGGYYGETFCVCGKVERNEAS